MTRWKITLPFGRTLGLSLLMLLGCLLICESSLRVEAVRKSLPALSLSREVMYPELDVKWALLEDYSRRNEVKCFILGSSMAESDFDPDVFSRVLEKKDGKNPHCFNFGLTGFKVESTARLAEVLENQFHPHFIFIGVSAVDFDPNNSDTRSVSNMPWFDAMSGRFSAEGWISQHSMTYRLLSLLPKLRSGDYRDELNKTAAAVSENGFRLNRRFIGMAGDETQARLRDYALNPYDVTGLDAILSMQDHGSTVFVIETPIMSGFMPSYVEGGQAGYEQEFLNPLQSHLQARGFSLLTTQTAMQERLPQLSWYNENHLNAEGALQFSQWVAEHLFQSGERQPE